MGWTLIGTIPGVASGGPNPTDAFGVRFVMGDTSSVPLDAMSVAMLFPDSLAAQVDAASLAMLLADSNAVLSDALTRLVFTLADSNSAPSDAATYLMQFLVNEPIDAIEDRGPDSMTLRLNGFNDSNAAPGDARTSTGYFWLSGTTASHTSAANPNNLNGANDGVVGSAKTTALGPALISYTSNVGAGIPAATPFTAAIYRGWFSATAGVTSTKSVIMHSSSALFTDVVMATTTATFSHLDGSFTFDLIAAGINTLAKLQSCQVIHQVDDTVKGTGGQLNVDAGRIELTNII